MAPTKRATSLGGKVEEMREFEAWTVVRETILFEWEWGKKWEMQSIYTTTYLFDGSFVIDSVLRVMKGDNEWMVR